MSKFRTFKKNVSATLIGLAIVPSTYAGVVRDDVDYQQFRDFAENKGKFVVDATNVEIKDKNGNVVETMFANDITMPDWSAVNTDNSTGNKGVATLIDPQYIVSVSHNGGYQDVQFGSNNNQNPDNEKFNYKLVERNNYDRIDEFDDYHQPRLHKLVTETAPIPVVERLDNFAETPNTEKDKFRERFPILVRMGSGVQVALNEEQAKNHSDVNIGYAIDNEGKKYSKEEILANNWGELVADGYHFLTGGLLLPIHEYNESQKGTLKFGSGYNLRGLNNNHNPSDKIDNISTLSIGIMSGDSGSPIFAYDKNDKQWKLIALAQGNLPAYWVSSETRKEFFNFFNNVGVGSLNRNEFNQEKRNQDTAGTINNTSVNQTFDWVNNNDGTSKIGDLTADLEKNGNLHHGKTVYFTGEKGILNLKSDINQGAGALYFNNDFTVKADNADTTWLGAGVSVAKDKTVTWQIKNPENDRLSKIGEGTLLVNGTSENKGDISVGDGLVVLNQQGGKAFNKVGIVSGRPTVKLETGDQVIADNIYFGYRGGRLDVNGNDLTFNYIKNVDEGAKIVNHHADKTATVTIKTDATDPNKSAFNGVFGENNQDFFANPLKDKTYHNGKLNIIYSPENPQENKPFLLSGGTHLNGNLTVEKGALLLSGRPTPHAYDHLNNIEPFKDNDWISRDFTTKTIVVKDNAKLTIGRNVKNVKADFELNGNATAQLGFINGSTPVCVRSDYKGDTTCENKSYGDDVLKEIPTTNIVGNIVANDNSTMTIGNAHLTGKSTANGNTSTLTLTPKSKWTMTGDSSLGHLTMENGSEITLNANPSTTSQFNTLTVNGNLTGEGQFNYSTNIGKNKGDKVVIKGIASGNHTLNVKDTGSEPNAKALVLLDLQNQAQTNNNLNVSLNNSTDAEGYVDLGAWRYKLEQQNNQFVLVSNKKQQQTTNNTGNNDTSNNTGNNDTANNTGNNDTTNNTGNNDTTNNTGNNDTTNNTGNNDTTNNTGNNDTTNNTGNNDTANNTGNNDTTNNTGNNDTTNNTGNNTSTPSKQADNISRYTNTALSELSAQADSLNRIGYGLTHHLSTAQGSGLWLIANRSHSHHKSDLYREYQKDENLMQLGLGHEFELKNSTILVGGAWAYSDAYQKYHQDIQGDSDLNLFSLYGKFTSPNQRYISLDMGVGQSKNKIKSNQEQVDIKRDLATVGLNIGQTFKTKLVDIQPNLGVRYHHLSGINYTLNGAKIQLNDDNLVRYRAGVILDKSIPFASGLTVTPSLSSDYVDASRNKAIVNVNGYDFKQQFGRYHQHTLGLSFNQKMWEVALNASLADGNEIKKEYSYGLKLNYKW